MQDGERSPSKATVQHVSHVKRQDGSEEKAIKTQKEERTSTDDMTGGRGGMREQREKGTKVSVLSRAEPSVRCDENEGIQTQRGMNVPNFSLFSCPP